MTSWRDWWRRDDGLNDRPRADVGDDVRVYAIGDLHGRLDLMETLLDRIAQDGRARGSMQTTILFLGDLVDRGPNSRRIVERMIDMMATGDEVRCLKGNHEELFVLVARGEVRAVPTFRKAGGAQTLSSYGLPPLDFERMADRAVADWALNNVSRSHVDFLDALPDTFETGDYLFVHAGIRPGVKIAEQRGEDLRWIRHDFLDHQGAHPRMIVHGHSITEDVDIRDNRIGIDTGAFMTGRLTAIGIQGTARWFLQTDPTA
ncbi:serine/threonine protein phosphatase 1 [Sphingobium sp. OAS761]|uniref:metallophosphoesterase family protein n=1 Tax=Sphingobium sp. OAS761 TaxID=2817901 RepID=UPI00209CED78|nr:metallophosphoesterase family protein [Sphingobium sp. OAS761]MCP1470886.1 serine/threonine protein phosphatase 1 [Sphingobium sp. OAS761]